jgi:pimeloyl-ACP methyl ester carboxylesterase
MMSGTAPRSLFIDLGGSRRHVVEWGQRGAPVLLLQHGMRDHARSWDWIAERFAAFYHILAPDLRGHGDSDWSRDGAYALSDYVSDMAEILEALDLPAFDLIGHSLGGHITLRFAAAFPEKVRSLTIIEGIELPIIRDQRREPIPYPERLRQWIDDQRDRRARSPRYYPTLEDAQARMAEQHPTIDAEIIAHLTRHGLIAETGKGLRWKYDNACRFRAPDDAHGIDLNEILDAIACPTLLAYGEASWIPLPPPERLNRIRAHRVVTFPAASHWLHHQARKPFLAALANFLSQPESCPCRKREAHA